MDGDFTANFAGKDWKQTCEDSGGMLKDVAFLRLDDAEEQDAANDRFTEEDYRQAVAPIEAEFSKWTGWVRADLVKKQSAATAAEQWNNISPLPGHVTNATRPGSGDFYATVIRTYFR